jgi:hypothetical protein
MGGLSGINFLSINSKVSTMAACNFSIPFSGSPSSVLNRAQAAIHDQGGHFRGDDMSGAFQLTVLGSDITGSYNISGQELVVTIDSKPFMIPCSTIQSYLTKHLQAVGA